MLGSQKNMDRDNNWKKTQNTHTTQRHQLNRIVVVVLFDFLLTTLSNRFHGKLCFNFGVVAIGLKDAMRTSSSQNQLTHSHIHIHEFSRLFIMQFKLPIGSVNCNEHNGFWIKLFRCCCFWWWCFFFVSHDTQWSIYTKRWTKYTVIWNLVNVCVLLFALVIILFALKIWLCNLFAACFVFFCCSSWRWSQ